jgi:hypothetical protein
MTRRLRSPSSGLWQNIAALKALSTVGRALRGSTVIAVFLGASAFAATQWAHTLAQRAAASDRVVVADVVGKTVVPDVHDVTIPSKTITRLRVVENVRGSGPEWVDVVQLGGQLGNRVVGVAGDASFSIGERAVVFLHCPSAQRCYLVALSEGKLPVVDEGATIIHDMVTGALERRPLREVLAEIRRVPSGVVLGPASPLRDRAALKGQP